MKTIRQHGAKKDDTEEVIKAVDKKYGKGTVRRTNGIVDYWPSFPSGSWALDVALGIGGYPRGRIVEIYGPEASGKTTLALHAVASALCGGFEAAFVDAEHALDMNYAKCVGVDPSRLVVAQPDYGEQALDIVDIFVRSGKFGLIVVDSVSALVPKEELDGEMGDQQIGLQARLMSKALRKLAGLCSKTETTIIFVNQLRQKIGQFVGWPETTTGGNALKFYASTRLDVRRKEKIVVDDKQMGNLHRIRVVKNKLAPPFTEATVNIIYGRGIDQVLDLIDVALELEIIQSGGAWFTLPNGDKIQGRFNLEKAVRKSIGFPGDLADTIIEECIKRNSRLSAGSLCQI